MRTLSKVSVLPVALFALACGDGKKGGGDALSDDLRRDLARASAEATSGQLASARTPRMRFVSEVEQSPSSAPERLRTPDRPSGRRRVHSHHPTASAAPSEEPAPADEVAEVASAAPAPAASEEPAPTPLPAPAPTAPRPTPVSMPAGGGIGEGDYGRGRGTGGMGPAIGTVIGVVIRGGGVGDVDHCERDFPVRRGGRGGMSTAGAIGTATVIGTAILVNRRAQQGGLPVGTFPR